MNATQRMEELISLLNEASEAYYGGREEIMTNYEWDAALDELAALETETGRILPNSPTQNVSNSETDPGGQKEPHEFPALSLAKTKQVTDLQKWTGDRAVWLSWKLDGLTLVATYDGGKLTRLMTRGNGLVGNNITYMKDALRGLPATLHYTGHLVVRGEAAISYPDFERVNAALEDEDEKFANPRNLASGTLALDVKHLEKVKERGLTFHAFTLVHTDETIRSWGERMSFLEKEGFVVVDREKTDFNGLPEAVERWTRRVEGGEMPVPVDGLVITYDDTDYAAAGNVTGHHATRGGLAFKWQDTAALSVLDHIEWSCAASIITPVAVFSPVQLEGTTVSRASLCNISELERLGIGADGRTELKIIKANKIIPKCVEVTRREGMVKIPEVCPVCGAPTRIMVSGSGTKTLRCENPDCAAKNLMKFSRFVSKQGLDIDGLSIETLRDFIAAGFLADFADIYRLRDHAEAIRRMEGYGDKSCENLLAAVEKSRAVHPAKLLTALCIPLIGADAAKKIVAAAGWPGVLDKLASGEGFEAVEGIGPEKSGAFLSWYAEGKNRNILGELLKELVVAEIAPAGDRGGSCEGLIFVITGEVHTFKNREAFKTFVEENGGHVAGSVSGKTSYLVNNDSTSTSSKNKKASELGIPIITEDEFIERFGV